MKLFKDEKAHEALKKDLEAVLALKVNTRIAEESLDGFIETMEGALWENLTDEAGKVVQDLMEQNPDSGGVFYVLDFVEFQNSMVLHQASWLDKELGLDVPDTVESVRVYQGGLFIEVLKDGRFQLVIENQCWITPETSLLEMELHLYSFAQMNGG